MAPQLVRDLLAVPGRIFRQTVYRRLAETGFYARRPIVYVHLNAYNRKVRLLWSQNHQSWKPQHWGRVLFSEK
ncbi:hypothetical protein TNCV_1954021 [Trichonephila clavipes]|nr:hypothetical protein TNCV_1954021 [Trichonephila clavipes]